MEVGRYCKAYQVRRFREYPQWRENADDLPPRDDADANERPMGERHPRALNADEVLYLQESLTVTRGIALNEQVVFDDVTPAWRSFCEETLGFRPPSNLPPET
jgi:hypothetical protein